MTKVLDRGATTQGWYAGPQARPVWLALLVIPLPASSSCAPFSPMGPKDRWIWRLAPAALVAALLLRAASHWTGLSDPPSVALSPADDRLPALSLDRQEANG